MADKFVETKLNKWGLISSIETLVPLYIWYSIINIQVLFVFIFWNILLDEDIDQEALSNLMEQMISTLIPKIGTQSKFLKYLNIFKQNNALVSI